MSTTQDFKTTFKYNLTCIFLSLRAKSKKPTILLIVGTLSLGGCRGHLMRPKLNSKVKSQMSKPNKYTDNIKSNLTCTFLSVRTKLKNPFCPRTLCPTVPFGYLIYAFSIQNFENLLQKLNLVTAT